MSIEKNSKSKSDLKRTGLHKRFINLSKPLVPIDTGTEPKLRKLSDIRVLAYDFYGTLFASGVGDIGVDDGSLNPEILLETFESAGITILKKAASSKGFATYNRVVEEIIAELRKSGIPYPEPDIRRVWSDVLEVLASKGLISYKQDNGIAERLSVEFEARMNPVWPMPDAVDTLIHFKEKGITQGIISNSQFYTPIVLEALTNHSLDELGFSEELLHWSFRENRKKPGLTFYRHFLDKLQKFNPALKPENVLYIGNDMLKDVYPAAEVGLKTALFAGDKRSLKWRKDDDRCKNLEPDLIITQLAQLKECVET